MLTSGIADHYHHGLAERVEVEQTSAPAVQSPQAHAVLFETDLMSFRANPLLQEEIFGPSSLLVTWNDRSELLAAAEALDGHPDRDHPRY